MKLRTFRTMLDPLEGEAGSMQTMRKSAKMTARIALVFAALTGVLMLVSVLSFGVSRATPLSTGMALIFIGLFFTNGYGHVNISSFLLCVIPSAVLLVITMVLKKNMPGDDLHYFDSRIILVGFCALPGMIFSSREPVRMYGAILFDFLCLALYDPVHEWFGLGYFQRGFTNATYYHINTIAMLVSLSVVGGIIFLKRIVVAEEDRNRDLLKTMSNQNHELETQNEEIAAQTEQLTAAFELIEEQKEKLEELVHLKNQDLTQSNEELRKINSELRQFSYTVSHNLRAPVARLLGLGSLVDTHDPHLSAENRQVVSLLRESTLELDTIIKELSRIIDIRNDLYTVKEKVFFEEEWMHVYKSLQSQIDEGMFVHTDFKEAPFVYTIRPFLHSILYNLASNAIRYRSPQRPLLLAVKTTLHQGSIRIAVSDNGLGINLDQFGKNLFGMYKRFHTHVEGRGLGLYLVKTQVEALQGTIVAESELNKGTTFTIDIKLPGDIEGQLCFDCDYGSVLYNARTNTMGLSWKRKVSSEEYRLLLTKCLEMLHVYNTPRWIADVRRRGNIGESDHVWFGESILNEGSKNGLRKIACIDTPDQQKNQRQQMIHTAGRFNIDMKFFQTRHEAESWIEQDA